MIQLSNLGSITEHRSGRHWTKASLIANVESRRAQLVAAGLDNKPSILITHGGSLEFFADLLAVWSVGGCALCLNQTLTEPELANLISFVDADALLYQGQPPVPNGVRSMRLMLNDQRCELPLQTPHRSHDQALILFTSGSTGDPKGVIHTAGTLSFRLQKNVDFIGSGTLENSLCLLPTHFGHGLIGNCLTSICAGQHLVLFPNPGLEGLSQLGSLIDEYQVSFMSSVPSLWKVALRASVRPADNTLKQVNIGSAPLSAELWKEVIQWSGIANVVNTYGITETANWCAGASAIDIEPADGLVGKPWGGEIAVLNEHNEILKAGEGELLIKSGAVTAGYLKRPDLTENAMLDGWYRTGDQGRIDSKGSIFLTGRLTTQINRAGEKVLPEEVDLLVEKHPAVTEVCSFGIPDPIEGEIVGIAVCCESNLSEREMILWCSERIRGYCVPQRWFFVESIPKTDRGKVQRARVRDYCINEYES